MRVVIKVGTSTLTHSTGRLNIRRVETLCKVLSDIKNAGHEVVLVSSGAIGMGVGKLKLHARPQDMPGKQAAAAVGQCELMYVYDKLFSEYNHTAAQILLTGEDMRDEKRTVATDEIAVGDNDTLSALVAVSVKADLLVLLSDIDGLYTADPRTHADAALIPEVAELTPTILAAAGGRGSALGTGGMATKLTAASLCMEAGVDMIIMNGSRPAALYDVLAGEAVGTRFIGRK